VPKTLLWANRFPPLFGGTQTLFYNVCLKFQPSDIVVYTQTSPGCQKFDQEQKFKIYRTPQCSFFWEGFWAEIKNLRSIIKNEGIENIIFGNVNPCLTMLLLRWVWGHKYTLYAHAEEITGMQWNSLARLIRKWAIKSAQKVFVVSDYTESLIKPLNPQTVVLYNAVQTSEFFPEPKNESLLKSFGAKGKLVLMTLARLQKSKGHNRVLEVLPELIKKYPDLLYIIGGTGDYERTLKERVAQLNLQDYVIFAGRVESGSLRSFYNLCDIFVMPNFEVSEPQGGVVVEGFGIVFLEANACGKPVVGGLAGGVPSAIKDGYSGFLVKQGDSQDLYNKLDILLKDQTLRESLGKQGQEWAAQFTYDCLVEKLKAHLI